MRTFTRMLGILLLALLLFGGAAAEEACAHTELAERVVKTDACHGVETVEVCCVSCGDTLETKDRTIPVNHVFGEWALQSPAACNAPEVWVRVCTGCGAEESEAVGQPLPHDWSDPVILQEPDCENPGLAYADCRNCEARQEIVLPALGHEIVETVLVEATPDQPGQTELSCARCGKLLETRDDYYSQIIYNNTITSLGPCTRDLIGGQDWYRITPLDLTQDGTFTYPLIATNRYTVGNMTADINRGTLTVSYKIDAAQVRVNSETLIIYPGLEALRGSEPPTFYELDAPIDIAANFGDAKVVLLSLIIKADYDAAGTGVGLFTEDEAQMAAMREMIQ